jgi:predicted permease
MARLRLRIQMLFTRSKSSELLDDELRDHLDRQITENIAAGMGADDARYAALRTFGNPALVREQARAVWSWNGLESLARDLRYGTRTLRRTPGFAAVAILVMALGIGANVALFTVVRSVLLNPLPYRDPGRLVAIFEHETNPADSNFGEFLPVAGGSFQRWQKAAEDMAQIAIVSPWHQYNVSAEGGKLPEQVDAAWSSGNFFSVLGVVPAYGRTFTQADDSAGAAATVVLSPSFWRRRYNSDPAIVGKAIWLDAKPYTVIGVLPSSFVYVGKYGGSTVDLWTPATHETSSAFMNSFQIHGFVAVARLLPGATLPGLLSQLGAVQKQTRIDHPEPAVSDAVDGRTLLDDAAHDYKTALYSLLAAAGCVLLIACLNVASLLVARTAARRKEMAIRSALGGGRMRLVRERLAESLLLSAAGGAVGLLLAWAALQWLITARHDMNRVDTIHMDGVVALFAVGIIVACALFAGLVSALGADGNKILASLQESSRTQSGSRTRAALRKTLLVLEVGLTVVLLVGAGLLIESYQRLRTTDLGVPLDNVLTMHVSLPEARYKKAEEQVAFLEQLIGRVRALPGVQSAGLVSTPPGQGWGGDEIMHVVEHPPLPKGQGFDIMMRGADPGYFAAIQIPLLRGRTFTANERLERAGVAVLSQSAAQAMFPGEDPIGKHVHVDTAMATQTGTFEVIGVAGDTRWDVSEPIRPTVYWPIYGNDYSVATLVIRSTQNPEVLALPAERVIASMDRDLPVSNVTTLRQTIVKSTIDSQFDSLLVLGFAGIALVLAAAGLYGVLAYLVTQRTAEIGVRIALGAQRGHVLRKILFDGLRPALLGLGVGLAASVGTARLIKQMLYQTQPLDLAIYAAVAALLMLVAAMACLVPAWRASRLDPMQALRSE